MQRAASHKTIEPIQVLRGLAALAVTVGHFHNEFIQVPGGIGFGITGLGVDVFFVISGFVMVHACWDDFGRRNASANFFLRRLARIVPLYWIGTAAMLGLIVYTQPLTQADLALPSILGSFAFLPIPRPSGSVDPVLTVGWTLSYEMLFYVVFAFALLARRWIAIPAVSIFLIAPIAKQLSSHPLALSYIEYWISPRLGAFVLGLLLAVLYRGGLRINRIAGSLTIATGIAIMVHWQNLASSTALEMIQPEIAALLVVAGATFVEWRAPARLTRTFVTLGNASYALYLLHPFFLMWPRWYFIGLAQWSPIHIPVRGWTFLSVMLVASIAASIATYFYFERPLTRWLIARINRLCPVGETGPHLAAPASQTSG